MRRRALLIGAALVASLTACTGSSGAPTAAPRPTQTTSAVSTPTPAASLAARRAAARQRAAEHAAKLRAARRAAAARKQASRTLIVEPGFSSHSSAVTAASLGKSWHSGCPVGPTELRALSLTFWGFDGRAHQGTLIVRDRAVPAFVSAFRTIYRAHFPIRQMQPVSVYGGNDNRSMRHDNTSAFNCRYAVSNGPKHWSMHAYGEAVDINTVENPYYLDGRVRPKSGAPYMTRSNVRPGMVVPGSVPVRAFTAVGWGWGGNWSSSPDYQHFSSTGG